MIKRAAEPHLHDFQLATNMWNILVSLAREVPLKWKGDLLAELISYFLDLTVLSTAYGHLRTTVVEKYTVSTRIS